jgi:hypothetical protein
MNIDIVKHYLAEQILTAWKARKMYQDGAAERTGIQRESYLACADAQATRETFLREMLVFINDETNYNPGKSLVCPSNDDRYDVAYGTAKVRP